ncbi:hypothetical protein DIPPA_01786 [Diplonema papillatum]|nr:hypothetical protein DIPPA_01786 [Diplonema papillatum]
MHLQSEAGATNPILLAMGDVWEGPASAAPQGAPGGALAPPPQQYYANQAHPHAAALHQAAAQAEYAAPPPPPAPPANDAQKQFLRGISSKVSHLCEMLQSSLDRGHADKAQELRSTLSDMSVTVDLDRAQWVISPAPENSLTEPLEGGWKQPGGSKKLRASGNDGGNRSSDGGFSGKQKKVRKHAAKVSRKGAGGFATRKPAAAAVGGSGSDSSNAPPADGAAYAVQQMSTSVRSQPQFAPQPQLSFDEDLCYPESAASELDVSPVRDHMAAPGNLYAHLSPNERNSSEGFSSTHSPYGTLPAQNAGYESSPYDAPLGTSPTGVHVHVQPQQDRDSPPAYPQHAYLEQHHQYPVQPDRQHQQHCHQQQQQQQPQAPAVASSFIADLFHPETQTVLFFGSGGPNDFVVSLALVPDLLDAGKTVVILSNANTLASAYKEGKEVYGDEEAGCFVNEVFASPLDGEDRDDQAASSSAEARSTTSDGSGGPQDQSAEEGRPIPLSRKRSSKAAWRPESIVSRIVKQAAAAANPAGRIVVLSCNSKKWTVAGLTTCLNSLCEQYSVDVVAAVEFGTASLVKGDEYLIGDLPEAKATSLAALARVETEQVASRGKRFVGMLLCTAMGVDEPEGIPISLSLERIQEITQCTGASGQASLSGMSRGMMLIRQVADALASSASSTMSSRAASAKTERLHMFCEAASGKTVASNADLATVSPYFTVLWAFSPQVVAAQSSLVTWVSECDVQSAQKAIIASQRANLRQSLQLGQPVVPPSPPAYALSAPC